MRKKKAPAFLGQGLCGGGCLTVTYFHTGCGTIIGAGAFHSPVRDGKGWFHPAVAVRHKLSGEAHSPTIRYKAQAVACVVSSGSASMAPGPWGQAARAISNGQLNVSPRFHTRPINVLVWDGPSGRSCLREVSSRGGFPA